MITSKPNQAAIASKSNVSNIHISSNSHSNQNDSASLMVEDAPHDSRLAMLMSFDMKALEETHRMLLWWTASRWSLPPGVLVAALPSSLSKV